jgi:hypothetical protein
MNGFQNLGLRHECNLNMSRSRSHPTKQPIIINLVVDNCTYVAEEWFNLTNCHNWVIDTEYPVLMQMHYKYGTRKGSSYKDLTSNLCSVICVPVQVSAELEDSTARVLDGGRILFSCPSNKLKASFGHLFILLVCRKFRRSKMMDNGFAPLYSVSGSCQANVNEWMDSIDPHLPVKWASEGIRNLLALVDLLSMTLQIFKTCYLQCLITGRSAVTSRVKWSAIMIE